METLWGIDLGGTKIEGVVVPSDDPAKPLARIRIPTEADQGYEHIIDRCNEVVSLLEQQTKLSRPDEIGFGTPGSCDPQTGLMRNCNTTCLNGNPLPKDLTTKIDARAKVTNDANCFALAEATLGAAQDAHTVFGVIIGTGVGGGVVIDRQIIEGKNGIAGEWGHNLLDPGGARCYCGKVGCVETVISGTALERYYTGLASEAKPLPEILQLARTTGNTAAAQTVERMCRGFGQALAQIVNVLDPDVIVLGGGVGQAQELLELGTEHLRRCVFHEEPRLDVRRPLLGDSAGVFGAALQVRNHRHERH